MWCHLVYGSRERKTQLKIWTGERKKGDDSEIVKAVSY